MQHISLGMRGLSLLFLVTLITGWNNVVITLQSAFNVGLASSWGMTLTVLAFLFLLLNGIAALGLLWLKRWSFLVAYVAIPFSAFFFGVSYVPFVPKLFASENSWFVMVMINLAVLGFAIYLNIAKKTVKKHLIFQF